jgi:hypothetical protein
MEAAEVDSVWIEETGDGLDPMLVLAAIAAVTSQLRLGLVLDGSPSPAGVGGSGRGPETLQQISRQRFITDPERWQRVDVPIDRDAWAKTLADAEGTADGVLVRLDPRLLDILRHPHDVIDRSDLILAQG